MFVVVEYGGMVRVVNGSCNTFHCQSGAGEHDPSNDMMEPKISTS